MKGNEPLYKIKKVDIVLYVLLTLYFLVICCQTSKLNKMAALFPKIVIYIFFILLSAKFLSFIKRNLFGRKVAGKYGIAIEKGIESGRDIYVVLWMVFYILSLALVGYVITIPILLIIFLKLAAKYSWKKTISLSLGTFAFVYILFTIGLKINLYKGVLGII